MRVIWYCVYTLLLCIHPASRGVAAHTAVVYVSCKRPRWVRGCGHGSIYSHQTDPKFDLNTVLVSDHQKSSKKHENTTQFRARCEFFWVAPPAKADIATAILANVIEHLVWLIGFILRFPYECLCEHLVTFRFLRTWVLVEEVLQICPEFSMDLQVFHETAPEYWPICHDCSRLVWPAEPLPSPRECAIDGSPCQSRMEPFSWWATRSGTKKGNWVQQFPTPEMFEKFDFRGWGDVYKLLQLCFHISLKMGRIHIGMGHRTSRQAVITPLRQDKANPPIRPLRGWSKQPVAGVPALTHHFASTGSGDVGKLCHWRMSWSSVDPRFSIIWSSSHLGRPFF